MSSLIKKSRKYQQWGLTLTSAEFASQIYGEGTLVELDIYIYIFLFCSVLLFVCLFLNTGINTDTCPVQMGPLGYGVSARSLFYLYHLSYHFLCIWGYDWIGMRTATDSPFKWPLIASEIKNSSGKFPLYINESVIKAPRGSDNKIHKSLDRLFRISFNWKIMYTSMIHLN